MSDLILQLPPEIWLQVFDFATHIPGAYTYDDGRALVAFTRDSYGIIVHRRHREATDLMLAVSRVCKAWTPLAIAFLFKYLLVKSGDHAISIAAALTSHETNYTGTDSPGRWTVRLEIALEGVHNWELSHTVALTRIFSFCPNIRVFSTAFMSASHDLICSPFIDAMRDLGTRKSIRRLELQGSFDMFEAVLRPLASYLEALWLIPPMDRLSRPSDTSVLLFPALQTFMFSSWINECAAILPTCHMPVLQSLYLDDTPQDFYETYGPQLQRLTTGVSLSSLACLDLFTNLVEWTIPCAQLSLISNDHTGTVVPPPSIRLLTLIGESYDFNTNALLISHIALLQQWLEGGLLPALEALRFLLPLRRRVVILNSAQTHWEQAIGALEATCRQHGVILEASFGGDDHTADKWQPFRLDRFLHVT